MASRNLRCSIQGHCHGFLLFWLRHFSMEAQPSDRRSVRRRDRSTGGVTLSCEPLRASAHRSSCRAAARGAANRCPKQATLPRPRCRDATASRDQQFESISLQRSPPPLRRSATPTPSRITRWRPLTSFRSASKSHGIAKTPTTLKIGPPHRLGPGRPRPIGEVPRLP